LKRYFSFMQTSYSFLFGDDSYKNILRKHFIVKVCCTTAVLFTEVIKCLAGDFAKTDFAALTVLILVILFVPDFITVQNVKRKKERLKFGLADFMDRTAVLLDSGMPLWSAVTAVAYNSDREDPFADEMLTAVQSFSGEKGYIYRPEECMERLADRCSTLMVSSFVSVVVQNSRKGSDELASIFKTQAVSYRNEQRNMAKKRAEEASALMLFPTAIVFAAILAMVATPAIITVISGMSA